MLEELRVSRVRRSRRGRGFARAACGLSAGPAGPATAGGASRHGEGAGTGSALPEISLAVLQSVFVVSQGAFPAVRGTPGGPRASPHPAVEFIACSSVSWL